MENQESVTSLLVLDEHEYNKLLHLPKATAHSLIWESSDIFSCCMGVVIINGIGAVQRHGGALLCLPSLPLTMLFAACWVHFSLSFRVVYQLVGLQPICPFLL